MRFIIGIDIGGTFTDGVAIDSDSGIIYTAKTRTTPVDLSEGVMDTLDLLAAGAGITPTDLLNNTSKFAHGTTQTSNVMFTWTGARTCLVTTRGFGDELLMMRARGRVAGVGLTARRHFRATDKPPQLVPKPLIVEVAERIDHRGRVILPLTEEEASRVVDEVIALEPEAVAISLLWSHVNPNHELLLERMLGGQHRGFYVTLGHRLAPVPGEYERTATAVVDAYVGPTMQRYVGHLEKRLTDSGLKRPLLVLQTSGGVAQADSTVPINTIESGPAAGMVATKILAATTGFRNAIATDVGGTTFKVGLLLDGEWSIAQETVINQYTILSPALDLVSIGSGGGSVAWVEDTRLRVGPMSAGADPGPACYGWGGNVPTVTDADVVLGFIHPERFLGGRIKLHPNLAWDAIRSQVADRLFDGDVMKAAAGIRRVVDAQMGDLVRKMTIERGYDPRNFVLIAYGGAGPLHAVDYARGVGVARIVVPTAATVYSAFGAAASDIHHSLMRTVPSAFPENVSEIEAAYRAMKTDATELLTQQAIDRSKMQFTLWLDMRYERQLENIRVQISAYAPGTLGSAIKDAFESRYKALYGRNSVIRSALLRVQRVGLDATGLTDKPRIVPSKGSALDARDATREARPIYWPGLMASTKSTVWEGPKLRPGSRLIGPGVIEHEGTTIAIPSGVEALVDSFGNTLIDLRRGASN